MYFNVPQYIDIEDKIAFQLTAKQLGWFALGGVGIFLAWNYASRDMFFVWSLMIALACLAFAFLRPYGITLMAFIGYGFLYFVKPKQFVWNRQVKIMDKDLEAVQVVKKKATGAEKSLEDLDQLAHVLDRKKIQK